MARSVRSRRAPGRQWAMSEHEAPGVGNGAGAAGAEGLLHARAAVVHDLAAAGLDSPAAVDVVEDAVAGRRWWVERWHQGLDVVAGQIAQDVQDPLLDDTGVRWPLCHAPVCDGRPFHSLAIVPELGPEPHWVCEEGAVVVAPLGRLPRQPPGPPELTGGWGAS